jgi:hypothetical protein
MATRNPLVPGSAPPLPLNRFKVWVPAAVAESRKNEADVPGTPWIVFENVPEENAIGATG